MPTMTYSTRAITEHIMTTEQSNYIVAEAANRTAAGLTDGVLNYIPPGDRTRYWVDQAAAQDWESWVMNYAAQQGFSFSLFEVVPI